MSNNQYTEVEIKYISKCINIRHDINKAKCEINKAILMRELKITIEFVNDIQDAHKNVFNFPLE